jgi:ubiquinone/menaquinone biosynthesis C-methylase UbiE
MPLIDESSLSELLSKKVTLRLVEPHIYSVIQDGEGTNSFDRMAGFYDLVICNPLYNRLVWGYSVKSYDALTRSALTSSKDGWVLDAGCGSLAFAVNTYLGYSERPVLLLDQSLSLLRIAKSRLIRLNGSVPPNMVFLHGDALDLPFKPKVIKTIISLNLLHVLGDVKKALLGFRNVLTDSGTMSLTTLIANNRFADKYLNIMLAKASGTAPRQARQLVEFFDELSMSAQFDVKGSMAFIYCNNI